MEFLFQGLFEWMYAIVLEIWEYFCDSMIDIMSLDFQYLQSRVPIITSISQVFLAVGWALLIGNLIFQAIKSMVSGLGFEGEDPKLLFARTFVCAFLLMASPQICEVGLSMTATVMKFMEVPDAVNVHLSNESFFGPMTANWAVVIIVNLILMVKVLKMLMAVAERYVILAVLTITAPLAFGVGGSKNTSDILKGWCRMYVSMCLLMCVNVMFLKMLLSVASSVPSDMDALVWMVLVLAIAKVAAKADAIITRIGLNPAIADDTSSRPGMLSYIVVRVATSTITKALGGSGGGRYGKATGSGPTGGGPHTGPVSGGDGLRPRGASGTVSGAGYKNGDGFSGTSGIYNSENNVQLTASNCGTSQQISSVQGDSRATGDNQIAIQQSNRFEAEQKGTIRQTVMHGDRMSRKTAVQPGTHRGSSYIAFHATMGPAGKKTVAGTADKMHLDSIATSVEKSGTMPASPFSRPAGPQAWRGDINSSIEATEKGSASVDILFNSANTTAGFRGEREAKTGAHGVERTRHTNRHPMTNGDALHPGRGKDTAELEPRHGRKELGSTTVNSVPRNGSVSEQKEADSMVRGMMMPTSKKRPGPIQQESNIGSRKMVSSISETATTKRSGIVEPAAGIRTFSRGAGGATHRTAQVNVTRTAKVTSVKRKTGSADLGTNKHCSDRKQHDRND